MPIIRSLRTPLIVMFGVIMATVTFTGPANAAPYVKHATISVSNQTPVAGSTIQTCGLGFGANETVTIVLDANRGHRGTSLGSARTDSSGAFPCTSVQVGGNLRGAHKITATGTTSGRTASAKIRVLRVRVAGVSADAGVTVAGVSANAGVSADAGVTVAGVSADAGPSGLAFTGASVIGAGALGGLLLLGGAIMVFAGRRRKTNA